MKMSDTPKSFWPRQWKCQFDLMKLIKKISEKLNIGNIFTLYKKHSLDVAQYALTVDESSDLDELVMKYNISIPLK